MQGVKRKRRCEIQCTQHLFSLQNKGGNPKYDISLTLCPKYQREPLPPQHSYPIFNNDRLFYTSAFILGLDQKEIARNLQREMLEHNKLVKESQEKYNQIIFPKPNSKHTTCSVCKEQYVNYYAHIFSDEHSEKVQASAYNKQIMGLCSLFVNLWEGCAQKADKMNQESHEIKRAQSQEINLDDILQSQEIDQNPSQIYKDKLNNRFYQKQLATAGLKKSKTDPYIKQSKHYEDREARKKNISFTRYFEQIPSKKIINEYREALTVPYKKSYNKHNHNQGVHHQHSHKETQLKKPVVVKPSDPFRIEYNARQAKKKEKKSYYMIKKRERQIKERERLERERKERELQRQRQCDEAERGKQGQQSLQYMPEHNNTIINLQNYSSEESVWQNSEVSNYSDSYQDYYGNQKENLSKRPSKRQQPHTMSKSTGARQDTSKKLGLFEEVQKKTSAIKQSQSSKLFEECRQGHQGLSSSHRIEAGSRENRESRENRSNNFIPSRSPGIQQSSAFNLGYAFEAKDRSKRDSGIFQDQKRFPAANNNNATKQSQYESQGRRSISPHNRHNHQSQIFQVYNKSRYNNPGREGQPQQNYTNNNEQNPSYNFKYQSYEASDISKMKSTPKSIPRSDEQLAAYYSNLKNRESLKESMSTSTRYDQRGPTPQGMSTAYSLGSKSNNNNLQNSYLKHQTNQRQMGPTNFQYQINNKESKLQQSFNNNSSLTTNYGGNDYQSPLVSNSGEFRRGSGSGSDRSSNWQHQQQNLYYNVSHDLRGDISTPRQGHPNNEHLTPKEGSVNSHLYSSYPMPSYSGYSGPHYDYVPLPPHHQDYGRGPSNQMQVSTPPPTNTNININFPAVYLSSYEQMHRYGHGHGHGHGNRIGPSGDSMMAPGIQQSNHFGMRREHHSFNGQSNPQQHNLNKYPPIKLPSLQQQSQSKLLPYAEYQQFKKKEEERIHRR